MLLAYSPSRTCQAHQKHHPHNKIRSAPTSAAQLWLQHPHRRTSTVAKAQLGGMLDTVVTWGAVAASVGAISYSLFYDWKQDQPQQETPQQQQEGQETSLFGPPDNVTWAVMGVVSCIPFFNYLACVQGALTSDSPRLWYWLTALYTLPLLHSGFQLDTFSISMVALGAAHVQVLRIGATEPELQAKLQQQLKPLAIVNTLAQAAGTAAGAALGSSSGSNARRLGQGSSSGRAVADALQSNEGEGEEEEERRRLQELEEFDRRLQSKDRVE